jgi:predicted nucleic acid-binding protein
MNAVFADTAFYVALLGTRDTFHRAATEFLASYEGHTVTTEYVLVEIANLLPGRRQATRLRESRAWITIVREDRDCPVVSRPL